MVVDQGPCIAVGHGTWILGNQGTWVVGQVTGIMSIMEHGTGNPVSHGPCMLA